MFTPLKIAMTDSVSEPRTTKEPPKGLVVTQTRKIVNSTLVLDYRDICRNLDQAVQKVRGLIQAKNDLELMAQLSNISLTEVPNE